MKRICLTVTNDLVYDQRMQRICTSLVANSFVVKLVGRRFRDSPALKKENYEQRRILCFFRKGFLFYAEYNTRLFFLLLFTRVNVICAIDLDTILPCLFVSKLKHIPRIYDAHELFTELKEVIIRPQIERTWLRIEKFAVPKFNYGYTVSEGIAEEFRKRYGVRYEVIKNFPVLRKLEQFPATEKFILYQGAVNEARGLEFLIPAMKMVDCKLVICGDGNFMVKLKLIISENHLQDKILLKGMLPPDKLWSLSQTATVAVATPESTGLNQYLALPNKFFDYIHAGLPQVTVNYPEYKKINDRYKVAILLEDIRPATIATAINKLLHDQDLYNTLKQNCLTAREIFNWQYEERKLILFYKSIFVDY